MPFNNLKYSINKEGKYYVAQCLDIEVSSFCNNRENALENLYEAVELYFEDESEKLIIITSNPKL
jgi:predicted RNase H-like HicB family nuclease